MKLKKILNLNSSSIWGGIPSLFHHSLGVTVTNRQNLVARKFAQVDRGWKRSSNVYVPETSLKAWNSMLFKTEKACLKRDDSVAGKMKHKSNTFKGKDGKNWVYIIYNMYIYIYIQYLLPVIIQKHDRCTPENQHCQLKNVGSKTTFFLRLVTFPENRETSVVEYRICTIQVVVRSEVLFPFSNHLPWVPNIIDTWREAAQAHPWCLAT